MNRRQFIQKSAIGGVAISLAGWSCGSKSAKVESEFPKRKLGRTGDMLSIIGFGGIIVKDEEQARANSLVASAFDRGVNYFDVAPTYGNAEEKLGPALQPYRDRCFLACKTTQRQKEGAEKELHESLKKLQTDHFDLYQLHALTTTEDVETAFGPDGAMELFLKAKQDGKTRFLGFSAHSEEAALMALERYDFDTVLFPINFVCWHQGNFGPRVVATAKAKNMGILALKALALTRIPEGQENPYEKLWYVPNDDRIMAGLALRFTLSQGTTAAIPPGDARFFDLAMALAPNHAPLSAAEAEQLRQFSEGLVPLFQS